MLVFYVLLAALYFPNFLLNFTALKISKVNVSSKPMLIPLVGNRLANLTSPESEDGRSPL
jgi:hypothetical protein